MSRSTLVIKLGGSFLIPQGGSAGPNLPMITEMATTIKKLASEGHKLVVVVGGGIVARQYINAAAALEASNGCKDYFGMLVSRLNARLFIEALNDDLCFSEPAESLQAVRSSLQVKDVVVLGGLQPGQSTTAVAALCAEYVKAEKVIFSTDVEGVFTADPRKHPDATLIPVVTYDELDALTTGTNTLPGEYRLIDGVALTILRRSDIKAQILKGSMENILGAADGQAIGSTLVNSKD